MPVITTNIFNADVGGLEQVNTTVQDGMATLTNKETASVAKGLAVYISGAGQFKLANNDVDSNAKVFGLVASDSIAADASGSVQTDQNVELADWTAVAGTATLTAGALYYLDTDGKITATAPSAAGSNVVRIGTAISTTVLNLEIEHKLKNAAA